MSKMKADTWKTIHSNRHQFLNGNCNHARHNELCGIKERYCVQANHNQSSVSLNFVCYS